MPLPNEPPNDDLDRRLAILVNENKPLTTRQAFICLLLDLYMNPTIRRKPEQNAAARR